MIAEHNRTAGDGWMALEWGWAALAVATFGVYLAVVATAGGDLGVRFIAGFVVVGWPVLVAGATLSMMSGRLRHRGSARSLSRMVTVSLLLWGVGAVAIAASADPGLYAAILFWMVAPTVVAALVGFLGWRAAPAAG